MKPLIYYGQNREDIILSAFFKDTNKGFFVDVGACEPVKFSVTKLFYERGWNGINIEPQEREFNKLIKDRKRDINLNIGIADKPGKLKLRAYDNEALSTFSQSIKKKYNTSEQQQGLGYKDKIIEVKALKNVFDENKVRSIQFLKVDVEGFEYEVLKGNDWKIYRPEVLCIEANNMVKTQRWYSILQKADYIKVFFDGLNEYYVSKEKSHKAEAFKLEYQRLIVSVPTLSFDWEITMNRIVNQLEKVQVSLDYHIKLKNELEKKLDIANSQLENPKFLLKKMSKSIIDNFK